MYASFIYVNKEQSANSYIKVYSQTEYVFDVPTHLTRHMCKVSSYNVFKQALKLKQYIRFWGFFSTVVRKRVSFSWITAIIKLRASLWLLWLCVYICIYLTNMTHIDSNICIGVSRQSHCLSIQGNYWPRVHAFTYINYVVTIFAIISAIYNPKSFSLN